MPLLLSGLPSQLSQSLPIDYHSQPCTIVRFDNIKLRFIPIFFGWQAQFLGDDFAANRREYCPHIQECLSYSNPEYYIILSIFFSVFSPQKFSREIQILGIINNPVSGDWIDNMLFITKFLFDGCILLILAFD